MKGRAPRRRGRRRRELAEWEKECFPDNVYLLVTTRWRGLALYASLTSRRLPGDLSFNFQLNSLSFRSFKVLDGGDDLFLSEFLLLNKQILKGA